MVDFESAFKALISDEELGKLASREYSDVRDTHGHQYVDLVMEGGGMLGFALLGYTYALERCGIRFWSIAGTSAGAISAMLLAGLGHKQDAKSLRVLGHLNGVETSSFLDGPPEIRGIFERWLAGSLDKFKLATAIFASDSLEDLMRMGSFDPCWLEAYRANGLFPGEEFRKWVSGVLGSAGVRNLGDLQALLETVPPELEIIPDARRGVDVSDMRSRLALIAADVTTESLVIFPEMAERYWAEPESVNPADFVRASMSIPFFFRPFVVPILAEHRDRLRGWGKSGPPSQAVFVDGGILSNFPIAVFHEPGCIPTHPTFGVKLNPRRRPEQSTSTPGELMGAIYNTARHSLDNDFLRKNTEYKRLVAYIDTLHVNWLDFSMSDENKLLLFTQGVSAARHFLEGFDWRAYKNLRHEVLQVHRHH